MIYGIVIMQDDALFLGEKMLKYLTVKCHNVCNLFSKDWAEGKKVYIHMWK